MKISKISLCAAVALIVISSTLARAGNLEPSSEYPGIFTITQNGEVVGFAEVGPVDSGAAVAVVNTTGVRRRVSATCALANGSKGSEQFVNPGTIIHDERHGFVVSNPAMFTFGHEFCGYGNITIVFK
jgi:hypothetical protein